MFVLSKMFDESLFMKTSNELHNDVTFLPERMKIENVEKLVANLHDNKEYLIRIRSLKQALNLELVLQKVRGVLKLNQKSRVKLYIEMNTELRKKCEK